MTVTKKQLLHLITGALAGLLAMGSVEALSLLPLGNYTAINLIQGLALGASFGLVFGLAEAFAGASLANPSPRRFLIDIPWMVLLAAGGGILAVLFSAQLLLRSDIVLPAEPGPREVIPLALMRGAGWMIPGAFIGSLEGLRRRSRAGILAGIVGGVIGGFVGGLVLELLGSSLPRSIGARLAGYLILGISIGTFLGLFERRFAYARVRVLSGPARNREYLLSDRRIGLGSGRRDVIRLDEYESDGETQCVIERRGSDMFLSAPGDSRVLVNDRPAGDRRILKYGDVLQIASAKLLLRSL